MSYQSHISPVDLILFYLTIYANIIFQFIFSTDRFGMLPLDEPAVLISEFLDRFQSLCHLDLQLPSLKPEDLKIMVSFFD